MDLHMKRNIVLYQFKKKKVDKDTRNRIISRFLFPILKNLKFCAAEFNSCCKINDPNRIVSCISHSNLV